MLVDVALPLPLFRSFTYEVDDAEADRARVGSRAVVPFRSRHEIGVIVGEGKARDGVVPKRAIALPDPEPVLDANMLALCRWMADYYATPLGVAIRTVLPAPLTAVAAPVPTQPPTRVLVQQQEVPSLLVRDQMFARAPRQRALFELLESTGGRAPLRHLADRLKFSASVVDGLVARGLVTVEDEIVMRDPFASRPMAGGAPLVPTDLQAGAIAALSTASPGQVFLLHGITGSGKTLVYIELLREVVERRGQTGIVLVPEIALTTQTVDRFRSVFGDRVAVLHSGMSDGERYDAWAAVRSGTKRIVVGARSAVFAPLENLGAIIVDEEHESSYKQGEAPRYHAREAAIVRARQSGAVVVLGSATPSLESWTHAQHGRYRLLSLPDRVGGGALPPVEIVDRRERALPAVGARDRTAPFDPFRFVISEPLEDALRERLDRREQSVLFLNRRGYASFLQCGACGDVAVCPNCSISLTLHRAPERLVCHYCQHAEEARRICQRCGGVVIHQRGLGTQQVEQLLIDRFPSARIARMDVDTTSARWAHTAILDRVGRQEVDILLGTQMIAKGLDFPNVTLVGVIDADVGINLPDFRASERCFQLLSQVAGRAGRGPKGGRVLIQTRVPSHHAVVCAAGHDFQRFVREETQGRETPLYPPFVRLARVLISGTAEQPVAALAEQATEWLRALAARRGVAGLTITGPAPCPVERIKSRWRWHVLLKSPRSQDLTRIGRYFMERFQVPKHGGLRVGFDRDPVTML